MHPPGLGVLGTPDKRCLQLTQGNRLLEAVLKANSMLPLLSKSDR